MVELTDQQIQAAVFAVLRKWDDVRAWDRYTRESGPYDVSSLRPEVLEIIRAVLAFADSVTPAAPPDWKGYALLGTGHYAINHTPGPPDPELGAELIISIATEADKAGNRQVGEERDTNPDNGPLMPEQMAVRIGFLTATALDALESQLRHLRRENFPAAAGERPNQAPATDGGQR